VPFVIAVRARCVGLATGAWRLGCAAWFLAVVERGLRKDPVPRVAARIGVRVADGVDGEVRAQMPHDVWRATIAARRVARGRGLRGRCLRESLVVGALCRTRDPVLRIGVRRAPGGELLAHAWIELDGVTYDVESSSYSALEPVAS